MRSDVPRLVPGRRALLRLLLAASAACAGAAQRAAAQEAPLPAPLQAELIGKILSFDRALGRYDGTITIGVLHQPDNRTSVSALRDLVDAFDAAPSLLPDGLDLRIVPIELDERLPEGIGQRVDVLFLTPMRALDVRTIARDASALGLLTITAHPEYRREGPAIALLVEEGRPHIVLDLPKARRCGANFESRLLRLVEVVE